MSFHPNQIARRGRMASIGLIVVFGLLAARAFSIQILRHSEYVLRSDENRLNEVPLPAPRGIIADRHGEVIAENVPGYTVSILAPGADSLRVVLRRLAQHIPLTRQQIEGTVRRHLRAINRPAVVFSDAPFSIVAILEEHRVEFPELIIQAAPKRHYRDSSVVSAFVGYVSEVNEADLADTTRVGYKPGHQIGKAGLEAQYESRLRGVEGSRFVEVDARHRVVRDAGVRTERAPVAGPELRTNIDMKLQRHIARVFGDSLDGAVVVLDPKTGAVLALYSAPGYDPNEFIGGASHEWFNRVNTDPRRPLFNKAIQGTYPPGSTWKLATAVIALENGIARMNQFMPERCDGGYQLGRRRFRCWKREGHGSVDLRGAIEHSCDVYFYQLGQRIALMNLVGGGRRLGFGERTRVDLPGEIASDFPPSAPLYLASKPDSVARRDTIDVRAYYERKFGSGVSLPAEVLNLSIGQGSNSTTVISMARFYTALATDGHMARPRIVQDSPLERTRIFELTEQQLRDLRDAMVGVVSTGTAASAAIRGVTFAGKTGTAQNAHDAVRDHAWFVGFAPAEEPAIVIAVMLEFGLHGSRAARIAKSIVEYHLGTTVSAPVVTGD